MHEHMDNYEIIFHVLKITDEIFDVKEARFCKQCAKSDAFALEILA